MLSSSYKPTNPTCSALDTTDHPVFRKPLEESLRCASVRISLRTSTPNTHGDLYVWGFVPIVIAKWSVPFFFCLVLFPPLTSGRSGLYLKENGPFLFHAPSVTFCSVLLSHPQRRKFRAYLALVGPTDACAISRRLLRALLT